MQLTLTGMLLALVLASAAGPTAADGLAEGLKDMSAPLVRALSLLGTPYKSGGNTPETGLDCSGLVRLAYRQSVAVELPHNAREISQRGVPVDKSELQPGDLVFFNTLHRPFSHVGIYKGEGKFVHASSRRDKRVGIADMANRYWAQRYDGARRILPAAP